MILPTKECAFYALLHVPSGQLMRQTRHSNGYTQQDFPLSHDDERRPVRLITRESSAKQARDWWLKGKTMIEGYQHDDGEYDETLKLKTEGCPDRKPGDMVVVSVWLSVVKVIE